MIARDLVHRLYVRRLRARLAGGPLPCHVAMVMDGNRRWARQMGFDNPSDGHRHGTEHVEEVLRWCEAIGIHRVTIFVASADNLRKRPAAEFEFFMGLIEEVIAERLIQPVNSWRLHLAGRPDLLPDSTSDALKLAAETTAGRDTGLELTVAVGYDGRQEIVDAVREFLDLEAVTGATPGSVAARLTVDDIAAHLDTRGQPDPDLVIRTSGEQRLSGFLLWQAAHSELYFCDVYWPGFREVDFLRALRTYARRR